MPLIGVWEKNPGQLSGALSQAFKNHNLSSAQVFSLSHSSPCPLNLDVLVWQSGTPNAPSSPVHTRALVVEGAESAAALKHCATDMVATVGLDNRDTVTLSSLLLHDGGIAALQRELVRLDGQIVSPQEMYLDGLSGTIIDKLAISTALLLCSQDESEA